MYTSLLFYFIFKITLRTDRPALRTPQAVVPAVEARSLPAQFTAGAWSARKRARTQSGRVRETHTNTRTHLNKAPLLTREPRGSASVTQSVSPLTHIDRGRAAERPPRAHSTACYANPLMREILLGSSKKQSD